MLTVEFGDDSAAVSAAWRAAATSSSSVVREQVDRDECRRGVSRARGEDRGGTDIGREVRHDPLALCRSEQRDVRAGLGDRPRHARRLAQSLAEREVARARPPVPVRVRQSAARAAASTSASVSASCSRRSCRATACAADADLGRGARGLADDRSGDGADEGGGRAGGRMRRVERAECGESAAGGELACARAHVLRIRAGDGPRPAGAEWGEFPTPRAPTRGLRRDVPGARHPARRGRPGRPARRAGRGSSCAASTQPAGAGGRTPIRRASSSMGSLLVIESPVHRTVGEAGIFHDELQFLETAGDAACDRAGGQVERGADRLVALVAGEESIEDVGARLTQRAERLVDVERLLDVGEPVGPDPRARLRLGGILACAAEPVDAGAAGELADPGTYRRVVPQAVEPLVRPGEDILEDVLGVLGREAEAADADRVDVARETLDEDGPRLRVALAAARDELPVTQVLNGARLSVAVRARVFAWPSPGGGARRSTHSAPRAAGTATGSARTSCRRSSP